MDHNQWRDKWLGKVVDFDGAFGGQCVDVARQYAADVHGIRNIEPVRGAVNFFTDYDQMPNLKANYFRIAYQEGLIAPQGALFVFGTTPTNSFGHIGVVDSGNQTEFISLDQDGFNNPAKDVDKGDTQGLKRKTFNYSRVLGWLVLKENRSTVTVTGSTPPAGAKIASSDRNAQNGDYWLNTSTNRWMQLVNGKWQNI